MATLSRFPPIAGRTDLPTELLEGANRRVLVAGLVFAALWLFTLLMNTVVAGVRGGDSMGAIPNDGLVESGLRPVPVAHEWNQACAREWWQLHLPSESPPGRDAADGVWS